MSPQSGSEVRIIEEADYAAFVQIVANAYPGIKLFTPEAQQQYIQRVFIDNDDPTVRVYGLYREGHLLGGMRLFDFTMQLFETKIPAGGVGGVAVDVLHKKEQVAKDLISFYLRHYRQRGVPLAILYPFRPDFYKQMGFGYGVKVNQYRVKPAHLPGTGSKEGVYFLKAEDQDALVACYNRFMAKNTGLLEKKSYELKGVFSNPETRILGYPAQAGGKELAGYMVFTFQSAKPDNFVMNNIVVRELVYENQAALLGLLKFLQTQADQINEVIFSTADDYFHFLLFDPRNGTNNLHSPLSHESNVQGVGLMYRVIDVPGFFQALAGHDFNGQTCRVKLNIKDSFLEENAGSYVVHFEDGKPRLADSDAPYEVELGLDVADFSSLVVGAVDFNSLYRYGLVSISNPEHVERLNRLFRTAQKPVCTTPF